MPPRAPAGIEHKRGASGILLRRLPRVWLHRPNIRPVQVPPFAPSLARAIDPDWQTVPVAAIELVWAPCSVSEDACRWPVTVSADRLRPFDLRVFGTTYRSHAEPVESDAAARARLTPPTEEAPPTSSSSNPYAHLYDLLYPPADEVIAGQISLPSDLHPYQHHGIQFLVEHDHALLADDMGLGKTAQCVLALAVLRRTERVRRTLIICPRAVIRQWQQEALRWAGLHLTVVDGPPAVRKRLWRYAPGVLLTTPNLVLNDREAVQQCRFDLVVCDDVAPLKSPGKITSAIRGIPRSRSWCLNGTPLENKPEDFANVLEFVRPGLFSAGERLRAPSRSELQQRVKPYVLRRRKRKILPDLPQRIAIDPLVVDLRGQQLEEYRKAEQLRWRALADTGGTVTKWHIFRVINELMQLCNYEPQTGQSAKLGVLTWDLRRVLRLDGELDKALVCSQRVATLKFLAKHLADLEPLIYHGSLGEKEREKVLDSFRGDGRLLLMSTKAGGRGLNLDYANHVFHFDRCWNPAWEEQAESRCWRLGQKKTVFVYRYIAKGTIEERIDEVLRHKQQLFTQIIESLADDTDGTDEAAGQNWSLDELIDLLRPQDRIGGPAQLCALSAV